MPWMPKALRTRAGCDNLGHPGGDWRVLHCRSRSFHLPVGCVLRHKAKRQPIAWLAWLAMALLFVAPLVSRVLPTSGSMAHAMVDAGHASRPDGAQNPMDCCGYCVLLGQQSLLATCVILHLLPPAPREAVVVAHQPPSPEPPARLWASPRGPPRQA
jgi:hypothetical protein